ncbi:hypothetical protein [Rhodoferax sp.]|uniref:hypothetical protein n=1 Tax=Rhodoferax sp. TaxID=50421 RepID=UPI0008BCE83A|nr:hypothetical protein [Rhodoferax sp.]MDO8318581.1 hypothetical protein [Rhodoferax sp.]MDP2678384.1 hypothetical protein [Rhodoferax sp.]OGB60170.1 MAG: hypothetical protein A2503_15135 [Burkholderiales bacterium RIFOXYD12_FULL_59_19]OGB75806.1 MAG: hypothetical protein A2496_20350 [Burkholderiales bacterium RIFOXYC12_FULL_60_6]
MNIAYLTPPTLPGLLHFRAPTSPRVCSRASASMPRPLRVLRVLEAGQAPSQVGRMVISGRMADVCAELDRLAAFERTH